MKKIAALLLPLVLAASVSHVDAASVLACQRICRSTGRACALLYCRPPANGITKRQCRAGMRAGAIGACIASGPSACPRRACSF